MCPRSRLRLEPARCTTPGPSILTAIDDMIKPTHLEASTMPAMVSSGRQFCADTKWPVGATYRSANFAAQAVSNAFTATIAMSNSGSSARDCDW